MNFVHLHTHSHYTFQRALGTPEAIAKKAKELGQTAIALTDTGNMYGAFEFYMACRDVGIKPILGVEFLLSKKGRANRDKDNELFEIVLLAKNRDGYKNLIDLVTLSQIEGYVSGRPRIDFDLLEKYHENLIALSGSMYGEIAQMISTGKEEKEICKRIDYYISLFGKDNYYLEIEEHPDKSLQPHINDTIVKLAKKYDYEFVGTNNSYYVSPEDASVQDIMMSVSDGRSLDDPDRNTLMNGDYSIRSSREMEELFIYAPKAYENTAKIASMIELELDVGGYKIPKFPLTDEQEEEYKEFIQNNERQNISGGIVLQNLSEEEWFLRKLCIGGLEYRYDIVLSKEDHDVMVSKLAVKKPEKKLSEMIIEELQELSRSHYPEEKKLIIAKLSDKQKSIISRLEYELLVVDLMGFNGYFCIVADFIKFGKNNGVPVGPGRGSAAGAILAYLSGITDIDPLRYGLLFERFLNPSRVTMPDIDVDFSDEGRDKVLVYVREKYGNDHVAQVCTFGTLAARAAIKDAGRAFGIPFQEMNEFAKLIPGRPGTTLSQALEEAVEFKAAYDNDEKYKKIVDTALKMEGSVRQLGVHACAVIIAPEPMTHFCPLQPPPKDPNSIVTQFSAGPLESLGLLKMDFLGLRNLAILDRAKKIVERIHAKEIDLLKIDYEDSHVLNLFSLGDMTGVFQFESDGMRRYLKELKPSSFEDLIAMVSLYRPGPMGYIPDFIDRKFGRKKVDYPHPSLEEILKPTYGIAVYQEQIMQLVQAFAGFSLGEADILRRAIGKKKYELLMEQRGKFIEAAVQCGNKEELAIYIFDEIIEPFAGYGFNKSHAACYAMIAYQTAYMKAYFPTEFMTAMMTSDEEDTDRIRLEITEAREKNIKILPPDVNESKKHFTYIDNQTIRFGLKAIKGLGDGPIDIILNEREKGVFLSIFDFIERTGGDVINKRALESLILSGALDSFGERASLLASIPKMGAFQKEIESKRETSQLGLFDMGDANEVSHFDLEKTLPMGLEDRIKGEKAMIGYPVSGHPLEGIESYIKAKSKNLSMVLELLQSRKLGDEDIIGDVTLDEDVPESLQPKINPPQTNIESDKQEEGIVEESNLPPQEQKEESIFAQLMGIVTEVRKIQTRNGGMMLSANVESVGFDFRIVIFPKDYDMYESKITEDTIVVVNGRVKFDHERGELSIFPSAPFGRKKMLDEAGSVKCFSISVFRDMANNSGMLISNQKSSHLVEDDSFSKNEPAPGKYYIDIPAFWTKQDLLDLRDFLEKSPVGLHPIWIRIHGVEKDTKFSIDSLSGLEDWLDKKGA
ncbi:MAG: DNA polymerase III subunit alpha [Candidatus Altimarinota bacterium]